MEGSILVRLGNQAEQRLLQEFCGMECFLYRERTGLVSFYHLVAHLQHLAVLLHAYVRLQHACEGLCEVGYTIIMYVSHLGFIEFLEE